MKAHLITSTEYSANRPSVFLQTGEGSENYYGCLIYPESGNFPQVDYWRTAICSDSDRYFSVKEIEVAEKQLIEIRQLQKVCNDNRVESKSYPYILKTWKIKRGKAYEDWLIATEQQHKEIKEEESKNAPFKKAYYNAFSELRNILLSL